MSKPVVGDNCYYFKGCHRMSHWVVRVKSGRGYVHRVGCHFSDSRRFLRLTSNGYSSVCHGTIVEVLGHVKSPSRGFKR